MATAARDYGWVCAIGLAAVVASTAAAGIRPRVVGLFHDDGIYVAAAKSIAEGSGYRLINLPGEPSQTKYPVLYSFLLAGVWTVNSGFPDNVRLLKGVNVALLFAISLVVYGLFRRELGSAPGSALAGAILVGSNSWIVSFTDFALSDTLFQAFACAALYCHDDPSRRVGTWRLSVGIMAALLGFLTREVGLALIAASMLALWPVHRRAAIAVLALGAVVVAAVGVWRESVPMPTNPLISYYTGYETSFFQLMSTDPWFAARGLLDNARYLLTAFEISLLTHLVPGLGWLSSAAVLIGGYLIVKRRRRFMVIWTGLYLAAVMGHPFVPSRYILPLLPIVFLCLLIGLDALGTRLAGLVIKSRGSTLAKGFLWAPLACLLAMNAAWLVRYVKPPDDEAVRIWYGRMAPYAWSGFTETFDWIKSHTREADVLASAYDPMYFLYTGRKGVRPWIHQPSSYFYPIGGATPNLGDPARIRDALNELGVRYLVIDPLEGYAEGAAAPLMLERLLATYPSRPELKFVSRDGYHKVYDLRPGG
jgi:hypothetical protein